MQPQVGQSGRPICKGTLTDEAWWLVRLREEHSIMPNPLTSTLLALLARADEADVKIEELQERVAWLQEKTE